jgi:hypothetical protein
VKKVKVKGGVLLHDCPVRACPVDLGRGAAGWRSTGQVLVVDG